MRPALLALVALAGCNQVFGVEQTALLPDADLRPDRDLDMIADVEDPCIASDLDRADDADMDGIPGEIDACPYGADTPDTDGDGVGDDCDPFRQLAGDRTVCAMRFRRIELNVALWKPRDGEAEFAVASGYLIGSQQTLKPASVVAQDRIAPTTGTITLDSFMAPLSVPFRARVWVSAGMLPSASDVACELSGDATGVRMVPVGAVTDVVVVGGPALGADTTLFVRIKIQPGREGVNLLCGLGYNETQGVFGYGRFDGPLGQQGFAVQQNGILIYSLVVSHRDDQPSLL